jgi:hypothetical protein
VVVFIFTFRKIANKINKNAFNNRRNLTNEGSENIMFVDSSSWCLISKTKPKSCTLHYHKTHVAFQQTIWHFYDAHIKRLRIFSFWFLKVWPAKYYHKPETYNKNEIHIIRVINGQWYYTLAFPRNYALHAFLTILFTYKHLISTIFRYDAIIEATTSIENTQSWRNAFYFNYACSDGFTTFWY